MKTKIKIISIVLSISILTTANIENNKIVQSKETAKSEQKILETKLNKLLVKCI